MRSVICEQRVIARFKVFKQWDNSYNFHFLAQERQYIYNNIEAFTINTYIPMNVEKKTYWQYHGTHCIFHSNLAVHTITVAKPVKPRMRSSTLKFPFRAV